MNKTPIEFAIDMIDFKPIDLAVVHDGSGPYATHEGTLQLGEFSIRVYQLNDGQRVLDADDFEKAFGLSRGDLEQMAGQ